MPLVHERGACYLVLFSAMLNGHHTISLAPDTHVDAKNSSDELA